MCWWHFPFFSYPLNSLWLSLDLVSMLPFLGERAHFQVFHIYSSFSPPPLPFMSQTSFTDCLEKRQSPQSQCWRHCPLITAKSELGGEGWAVLPACIPINAQRGARSLGSSQPQQGAEALQTCNTWPSALAAAQGGDPLHAVNNCSATSAPGNSLILFVACQFSLFLLHAAAWGNDSWSSHPHISSCEAPLRQIHCISTSQQEAGDTNQGTRLGISLPKEPTHRESELIPAASHSSCY